MATRTAGRLLAGTLRLTLKAVADAEVEAHDDDRKDDLSFTEKGRPV